MLAPFARPPGRREDAAPLIQFFNVTLRHQGQTLALQDVSFEVGRGEFLFMVGQTGSGKSSLLRLLNREMRPTEGSIWVDGEDITRLRPHRVPALRRKIGMVFQDFCLLPDRTVEENVAFALRVIGIHGRPLHTRVWEALELVGLAGKGKAFPEQISGGEQQRCALARAIVNRPLLLLADEPTGHLDPDTSHGIMGLLDRVNDHGTTVLVATHDQLIVDALRKRVIELRAGCVVRDEPHGRYVAERSWCDQVASRG